MTGWTWALLTSSGSSAWPCSSTFRSGARRTPPGRGCSSSSSSPSPPRFLHAKHIYVDGEVVLMGSSNFDLRSFGLNEEVSLVVYDDHVASELRAVIDRYFAHSRSLTRGEWARRGFPRRFAQNIARLVDSLL